MRTLLPLAGALLALMSNTASGCPAGIPPGTPGCIPPSNPASPLYRGRSQASTGGWWESRWGAIAVDGRAGVIGAAAGQTGKRNAIRAAEAECLAKGGKDCDSQIEFFNQCAVLVWGDTHFRTVSGPTIEVASDRALELCRSTDTGCELYYTVCSLPERVR